MPDVDDTITSLCEDAGVNSTTASADRVKALSCWNRAYKQIVSRYRPIKRAATLTLTASTDLDLILSGYSGYSGQDFTASVHARFSGLDGVQISGGAFIDQDSYMRVVGSRSTGASGDPVCYAYQSGTLHLNSASASTVLIAYTYLSAATLTESSVEADIDGIDPSWQEQLLLPLATAILLEGWEGEEQRAAHFRNLADRAEADYAKEQVRSRGLNLVQYPLQSFASPAPLSNR